MCFRNSAKRGAKYWKNEKHKKSWNKLSEIRPYLEVPFLAMLQSKKSNTTASIQHTNATFELGMLLLDGRFQSTLVDL